MGQNNSKDSSLEATKAIADVTSGDKLGSKQPTGVLHRQAWPSTPWLHFLPAKPEYIEALLCGVEARRLCFWAYYC